MWWARESGVQAAWQSKSKSNDTICTYMHIYIYIGWNWDTRRCITTGVLLRCAFFRSASTIQRYRGFMGKRERETETQRWLGASERNTYTSLDTAQYILLYEYDIYLWIDWKDSGNLSRRMSHLYFIYVAFWSLAKSARLLKPRVRVALMWNRWEYIWRYNSGFDCRYLSSTVAMLMLR